MTDSLPKPTSPNKPAVANDDKTVFKSKPDSSNQPSSSTRPSQPVQSAQTAQPTKPTNQKSQPVQQNQPVKPTNQSQPAQPTPATQLKQPTPPTQPMGQQVKLGGRNIPVPVKKGAEEKLTSVGQSNLNPALAPKPAAPLIPPDPTETVTKSDSADKKIPPNLPTKQSLLLQIKTQFKENPRKWTMIVLGTLFGLGLLIFLISRLFGGKSTPVQPGDQQTTVPAQQQTVLTYWGLWEPTAVLDEIINEYEEANPGIKIDYRVQSHKDYRERLQTAIASGNGPDIFRYHASWVPMLAEDLAVLPAGVMSAQEYQSTFYPVTAQQLQIEGKIVGLPMMYEGLMLYYNTEVLQTAGVEPPTTWSELKQLANELTVPASKNDRSNQGIQRSGLAIGNASNVDHFADVLALLILQNGGDPSEPAFTEVRDALTFYTNFVIVDQVWDSTLPNSTVAFARGDAVMMFAPSWQAHEIKNLNPQLQFATAPLPQLSEEKVAWANYWAEGVNERSGNKSAAWNFLKYLVSAEVMQKLYSAQSQVRTFGEPYSRQDLAENLQDDPYVGALLSDAPIATGWYMSSATHDNGINDNIIDYYRTAVNAVLAGNNMDEILLALEKGVQQELRQYGL